MKSISRFALPWLLTALLAVALVAIVFSRKESSKNPASAAAPSPSASRLTPPARKVLYWVDPMVAGYKSDKPGKSPFMDMDMVPVYEDGSSGETKEHTAAGDSAAVKGYAAVNLSTERQQAIGVRLGKAETRELTKTIRTVGRVTFDETLNRQIHSKFEGYVEKLYVDYTGKPVRKGQPLLSIYSPELLATQQEYLLALRARRQFQASSNVDLARGGVDLLDSARQRLLLWDISRGQIAELERTGEPQKALTLYSPVDGFVMTKNAVQGARVMPADTLFEIAGIRHVWVLADVYESEAPFVRLGQNARMSLSYLPGRTWNGAITFIAPVLDERTRTVKVRLEFENPDGTLKPEMYADVSLERPLGRVVTVPDGAVLSTGARSLVFVAKGEGRFEPRAVETGAKVDGLYEIRRGLAGGEQVVMQANFLIDSESRLKAALSGMEPAAKGPEPGAANKPPASPAAHAHGEKQ